MMPEAGGDYVYLRRAYGRAVGFYSAGWHSRFFAPARRPRSAVGLAIFMNVALNGALRQWQHRRPVPRAASAGRRLDPGRARDHLDRGAHQLRLGIDRGPHRAAGDDRQGRAGARASASARSYSRPATGGISRAPAGRSCGGFFIARGGVAGFGAAMLGALWAYDGWNNVAPLAERFAIRSATCRAPSSGARWSSPRSIVRERQRITTRCRPWRSPTCRRARRWRPRSSSDSSARGSVLDRGGAHDLLVRIAARERAFQFAHTVCDGARGLFFRGLAKLSPRSNVPVRAMVAQGAWASPLAVSGTYDTLTDSVVFASWLFYGLTAGALFVFRRTMPDAPRAYRALGYPVVPGLFLLVTAALLVNTFVAAPRQALQGVALLLLGLPFYWYWSRRAEL